MWPLFALRADVLKVTLFFNKQCRIKVINHFYMIVLFLSSNSMPFIRYLRRSEEKKRCHGDNNVALVTTFWCVALRKWCLRISYTCAVSVLSTHDWVENLLQPTVVHHNLRYKSVLWPINLTVGPAANTIQMAGDCSL